jgi:hypothetical protein
LTTCTLRDAADDREEQRPFIAVRQPVARLKARIRKRPVDEDHR